MSWITLTQNDLLSALNASEAAAYNAAVTGAIDPADEIILSAVHDARGLIENAPGNELAAGDTVPNRLKHQILAIVRFRILTRLDIAVSEDRRTEYRDARRFLERVSEGKVRVEKPDGAKDTSGGVNGNIDVVDYGPDTLDRAGLESL
jgi:phage gp36-like protein